MNKKDLISSEKIETPFAELNRSQFVTGSPKHQIRSPGAYAFTEQGVAMLSSVLRRKRPITLNIKITRRIRRTA